MGVSESDSEVEGTWLASLLMQGLLKVAYWQVTFKIVENMKKFKKSIEISTENISDVLQVPIVTSVYKTKLFKNPFIEGRSNPYDALAVMYVHVEGIKSDLCINQGDVLALDICDTWYAFSKAGWEKHKNDEV